MKFKEALEQSAQGVKKSRQIVYRLFSEKKMSHLEQFAHLLSLFTTVKEKSQKDVGEIQRSLRAVSSRCQEISSDRF